MIHFARTAAIVVACVALGTTTWAEESEDVQQVRDLLNTEFDGHGKGDPDQIVSCYSPDIVFYSGSRGRGPANWSVGLAGLDELRSNYAAGAVDIPAWLAEHPESDQGNEVRHINVRGDHAIASSSHWSAIPDSTTRTTIVNEHESVWILAKTSGEWKITRVIGFVTADQEIITWRPE